MTGSLPSRSAWGCGLAGNLKQATLQGSFWLFLRFAGRQGANTLAFFVMAALLAPQEFGLGSIAAAVGYAVRPLVYRGFRDAVIQHAEADRLVDATAWWLNAGLGLAIGGIIALAGLAAGAISGQDDLAVLLVACASIPFFTGISAVSEGRIERRFEQRSLTLVQSVASVLAAIAGIAAALAGWGAWAFVINRVLESALIAAGILLLSRWWPGFAFSAPAAVRLSRIALPVMMTATLGGSFVHLSLMIVGGVLGTAAAGYFRVATQIYQFLIQTLCAPVVQMILPAFARAPERAADRYPDAVALLALIALPAFFGAAAIAPDLLPLLLGPAWVQAGLTAPLLCFGILAFIPASTLEPVLIAQGRAMTASLLSLTNLVAGLLLILAGSSFGLWAASAGFALRAVFTLPLSAWLASVQLGVSVSRLARSYALALVPALIMYGGVVGLLRIQADWPAWLSLAVAIALGAGMYALVTRFVSARLFPDVYAMALDFLPARLRRFLA